MGSTICYVNGLISIRQWHFKIISFVLFPTSSVLVLTAGLMNWNGFYLRTNQVSFLGASGRIHENVQPLFKNARCS